MYDTRVYDIAQVNMKIEIQAIDWVIGTSDSKFNLEFWIESQLKILKP